MMYRYIKLILLVVLSVFFMDSDRFSVYSSGIKDDSTETSISGDFDGKQIRDWTLLPKDFSGEDYNDWNSLQLSPSQEELSEGRVQTASARIRSSVPGQGRPAGFRSVFMRGGKVTSIDQALTFFIDTGLFPSGKYSFSHHLISLRKMRL